jgi:activator of 2-hydroxyglutaryl-CoA dehydratase
MGPLALEGAEGVTITAMCATFAETEVISLLAEGNAKPDVLGAVHAAIATRTAGLVGRVGKKGPVVMTGGVAKNKAAVHWIEQAIGMPLILPPTPQIAGALGAALIGLDDYRAEMHLSEADDHALERQMSADKACVPRCTGQPDKAPPLQSKAQDLWKKIQQHL